MRDLVEQLIKRKELRIIPVPACPLTALRIATELMFRKHARAMQVLVVPLRQLLLPLSTRVLAFCNLVLLTALKINLAKDYLPDAAVMLDLVELSSHR